MQRVRSGRFLLSTKCAILFKWAKGQHAIANQIAFVSKQLESWCLDMFFFKLRGAKSVRTEAIIPLKRILRIVDKQPFEGANSIRAYQHKTRLEEEDQPKRPALRHQTRLQGRDQMGLNCAVAMQFEI
jgi:hypothetical protein